MDFNHYFTNQELENLLKEWAGRYPEIIRLSVIGESYDKRPIWLLTLTNAATGPDLEKPAVWIDANIHATEITGTTTALHLAHALLAGYRTDPQITRLLDHGVYYLVPRVNPDGAALALADRPRYIRSGVRPYPWQDKEDGLHEQDVDGDGRILQMRLVDPNGDWKVSALDPRLMQKRAPHEHGGTYYRLMSEGLIEDFDGFLIKEARQLEGLDFNRNFPFQWRTEGEQHGAGPYPTSEPEIRTLVDFVANHPNINIASPTTLSALILRSSFRPVTEMEQDMGVQEDRGDRHGADRLSLRLHLP
jgi:murein tripeptide amidase MpaA